MEKSQKILYSRLERIHKIAGQTNRKPRHVWRALLLLLVGIAPALPCFSAEKTPAAAKSTPESTAYLPLLHKPATLEQAGQQARELMRAMTVEERWNLVCGSNVGVNINRIKPVPRLGIPQVVLAGASLGFCDDPAVKSTAFPCSLLLAATWNTDSAKSYSGAIAEEFRALGKAFILGPGMNIYRNSQCGRNYEYMGEDPFLAGKIVASYVQGAQSLNVGVTLKHFLCNETDFHRLSSNSIVSERAIHEIFLPPFKAGVEAGAWSVMTSYNLLNGEWAGENRYLVTDILRKELGFQFLVMSDWNSTWHGEKLIQSGVDLEMPDGLSLHYDKKKVLGTPEIDGMVVNILKTCIYSGIYELEIKQQLKKPEWLSKYPQHVEIARKINHEGIVLLKNNGILPLDQAIEGKILVSGNSATQKELLAGGSSHVKGYDLKTYLQAVQQLYGTKKVLFAKKPTDDQIRSAALVLVFTGRPGEAKYEKNWGPEESEGRDHPYILPDDALIARCAARNPKTVVILTCGGGAQMDWADQAPAIVHAFLGGQTAADALFDILTGKVNPSGKLPFTIEKSFEDSCAEGYTKFFEKPTAAHTDAKDMAKRVAMHKECFLRNCFPTNGDETEVYTWDNPYSEGVFVGYRWYDSKKIEPRFPFGFGLSYTTYDYSDITLSSSELISGSPLKVQATIKNTGKREGTEVVELYVSEQNPKVPRPPRELKGFQRVSLEPGESKTVHFELNRDAFSYYDEATHAWKADPGVFEIQLGASSRDIKLKATVSLN